MKKLLILLFLGISHLAHSQTPSVAKARVYSNSGELDKAKTAIDKAVAHNKVGKKSSTWEARGDIYVEILTTDDERFQNLADHPSKIAFESYTKALELDKKGSKRKVINRKLTLLQNQALNQGIMAFNQKQYEGAVNDFLTSISIAELQGNTDTLALFNAAMAYDYNNQSDQAIKLYRQCLDLNYRGEHCCTSLIYIHQKRKDIAGMKSQIQTCRKKFPDDKSLLLYELDFFLLDGEFEKAEKSIQVAIQSDPTNHTYHYVAGNIQENLGNYDQAEKAYLKVMSLNPNHFETNYSLGALYYNEAVGINKKAIEETDFEKADAMKGEVNKLYKKALPYFEKAKTLKPTDRGILNSLMQLYIQLDQIDKYKEVKALLNN